MTLESPIEINQEIMVSAKTVFLEDYSKLKEGKYLFCYKITIENKGNKSAKLLNRHWIIIDSESNTEEVKGAGVLGLQPQLEPGQKHEYFSFCNLNTNFGTMEGSYEFIDEDNNTFFVKIPRFFLAENLNEFDKPVFKRGAVVKHKQDDFTAVITDYDMYFINDEEIYKKDKTQAAKDKPWYYVLINKTNAISYISQENLELLENPDTIEHPLTDFFFDGFDGEMYIRNNKTWDELKGS